LSNVPGGVAASDRGSDGGQVLLSLGVVVSQLVQVGVLEMLAAAERARVKHMVQFTNRGLPHYRWIKHLLEDGYIGMPYHAYSTRPTGWYPAQQPNS